MDGSKQHGTVGGAEGGWARLSSRRNRRCKQRVARPRQGRSGGYRTLILYRQAHRAFFVYGFAKSRQANISDEDEAAFKKAARHVLDLTDEQLAALIRNGQFSEVDYDD
ncbi:MAG: type II toxin-antitoxin system RelE/ParE family toxin [Lamprocystis purpurea]|uniref:type II toxin-antitoxin system RelE/ParE family toxin n=1 Tax=Lamprocystis purpurea TaxID=61598 RepID=UPI0012F8A7B4|nr:type II toxin-antitoxin system RelE/ParE family toxin [Lamprocystis purpurea]MBV5272484.1 type II toxin-antitoxin system RelE/ParE family toxin [Lamprocystis purpurea]